MGKGRMGCGDVLRQRGGDSTWEVLLTRVQRFIEPLCSKKMARRMGASNRQKKFSFR